MPNDLDPNQSIFSSTKEDRAERRKLLKASRHKCLSRLSKFTKKLKAEEIPKINGVVSDPVDTDRFPAPNPLSGIITGQTEEGQQPAS